MEKEVNDEFRISIFSEVAVKKKKNLVLGWPIVTVFSFFVSWTHF